MKENTEKTLVYYNTYSDLYAKDTSNLEFSDIQDEFLSYLKQGSLILDFGCGTGRDSKYFLSKGYKVEAIDGSEEMVRIASAIQGLKVKKMLFHELNETDKYDGIFACASLLHVSYDELANILNKLKEAIRIDGILYASFKYGDFEGYRNDRYFTNMNEERIKPILEMVDGLRIEKQWVSSDVRVGRQNEKWFNILLRKA